MVRWGMVRVNSGTEERVVKVRVVHRVFSQNLVDERVTGTVSIISNSVVFISYGLFVRAPKSNNLSRTQFGRFLYLSISRVSDKVETPKFGTPAIF
eukprot:sb/3479118/